MPRFARGFPVKHALGRAERSEAMEALRALGARGLHKRSNAPLEFLEGQIVIIRTSDPNHPTPLTPPLSNPMRTRDRIMLCAIGANMFIGAVMCLVAVDKDKTRDIIVMVLAPCGMTLMGLAACGR